MKSLLARAALFGLIFWLFVTAMIALPSFHYCGTAADAGGQRITLCSAFPEGARPGLVRRPPMAILAGAGQTSLVLTVLALGFFGLGRLVFVAIRRGGKR